MSQCVPQHISPASREILHASWARSWKKVCPATDGMALMERLLAAYNEAWREYHTIQHLIECARLLEQHHHSALHASEVGIALWFHDAVYDVTAHDNEARSADWAVRSLKEAGVEDAVADRVQQLIMATCHKSPPAGADQALLVDIDLAILGASRPRFLEYEAQVRAEYSWVADAMFYKGRREVLRKFQARHSLYHTPAIRESFEVPARENLAYSLRQLTELIEGT